MQALGAVSPLKESAGALGYSGFRLFIWQTLTPVGGAIIWPVWLFSAVLPSYLFLNKLP